MIDDRLEDAALDYSRRVSAVVGWVSMGVSLIPLAAVLWYILR